MNKPKIYVETTMISYLVARPPRNALVRGQMEATRSWWSDAATSFDLYVSALVRDETAAGDAEAAAAFGGSEHVGAGARE